MIDDRASVCNTCCNPSTVGTIYRLLRLPCGCQDVIYDNGLICREHDHVICDGKAVTADVE